MSVLQLCMGMGVPVGMGVPMGMEFPWKWKLDLNGNSTTREWKQLMFVGSQNHSRDLVKSHYTTCTL